MMNATNKRVAIVGAGPMGLSLAYYLSKDGYSVDIFEVEDRIGGMSASFDFAGLLIERFYHFICVPDTPLFALLNELRLLDSLRWTNTKMGYFYEGTLYDLDDPFSLLGFPALTMLEKMRYAAFLLYVKRISEWSVLDKLEAGDWITKWTGKHAYSVLFAPLFKNKFSHYAKSLSAAWIAARMQRVAKSRKNMLQARTGYLEGGTDSLLRRLQEEIEKRDGKIYLNQPVTRIKIGNGQVDGVATKNGSNSYSCVVSTIPLPLVPGLIPDLPKLNMARISDIRNIGVICLVFKLTRPLTKYFWLNISDSRLDIPGLVEYSNLRPLNDHIVYVPLYMPHDHEKWNKSDEYLVKEATSYLKRINVRLTDKDIIGVEMFRYTYAQPICTPNFYNRISEIETDIRGLYIADTTHAYPEDRSISESVRIARKIHGMILSGHLIA